MLINVLKAERPDHVAVVFDASDHTFRNDLYPAYKAQREASPLEFPPQIPLIEDVCTVMGLKHVQLRGYEADDIIATLAKQASSGRLDTLILTGDRDSFQLISDQVTVLYARRGVSDLARMTPAALHEKLGLTPSQYPDYAALRGDPSDNLPSVPGVGEKTAAKWIIEYGDLANLLAHVGEIKGKVGESLRAHITEVELNLQLTRLVTDVPIEVGVKDCSRTEIKMAELNQLFDALEFTSLRPRALALQGASATASDSGAHTITDTMIDATIDTLAANAWRRLKPRGKNLPAFFDRYATTPLGVAFQGNWGGGGGEIRAIAIASPEGEGFVFDLVEESQEIKDTVFGWLETAYPKVIHDAKGPALALAAHSISLTGLHLDTALGAYLALPGQRSFEIFALAERLCDIRPAGFVVNDQLSLGLSDEATQNALLEVAGMTLMVSKKLAELLHERNLWSLLTEIEQPLIPVLVRMERAGISVDTTALAGIEASLAVECDRLQAKAHQLVGHKLNLSSPKQLQVVLFEKRGLPKTKKTKTGWTTDADALAGLYDSTGDPLLKVIIDWRERAKLRQTVASLIPLVAADGRIHTTFNQMAATTGRLSSSDPNLQNIPARSNDGKRIRECFVAGPNYETLLTADYDQIELRVMAHMAKDSELISAFSLGEDLHRTVGAKIFNVEPSEVDADLRRQVKAISYGLVYGLSPYGLSQQLGISVDEAKELNDAYFQRFLGIKDYLRSVVKQARVLGYTETLLGRRRYLPDLSSDNRQRREIAERMALNAPMQGSAADIMKVAMLKVDNLLRESHLQSRLLLSVHDELVIEVAPGEVNEVEKTVREGMAGAYPLDVPLAVSVGIGRTWATASH
jgi:DNA polymerase-1